VLKSHGIPLEHVGSQSTPTRRAVCRWIRHLRNDPPEVAMEVAHTGGMGQTTLAYTKMPDVPERPTTSEQKRAGRALRALGREGEVCFGRPLVSYLWRINDDLQLNQHTSVITQPPTPAEPSPTNGRSPECTKSPPPP
jgi:hypothetical protein